MPVKQVTWRRGRVGLFARTGQHIEAERAPHQIRRAVATRPAPRRARHGETAAVHGIGGRVIPT